MMQVAQIRSAQKASAGQWFANADQAFEEVGQLLELHLSTCRETLNDMANCCQRACDVHDLPSAFDWQTDAFKPLAERCAEYGGRLVGLASVLGLDWGKSLQAQWASYGRQLNDWMGQTWLPISGPVYAPASEDLGNTMRAFDSVWDAMRQNLAQAQRLAVSQMQPPKPSVPRPLRKSRH